MSGVVTDDDWPNVLIGFAMHVREVRAETETLGRALAEGDPSRTEDVQTLTRLVWP